MGLRSFPGEVMFKWSSTEESELGSEAGEGTGEGAEGSMFEEGEPG